MKAIITLFAICTTLIFSISWAEEVPKPMQETMYNLTEAAAILNICFKSTEYKKLPTEKHLKLAGLLMRLEDLVQMIEKHYDNEAIFWTYSMGYAKYSSDPEYIEYARKEYQYCGDKLFSEMEAYVSKSEEAFNDYFSKKKQ